MFFEKNSSLLWPGSGPLRSKNFQKALILALEANSELSSENETKIVKITHSALGKHIIMRKIHKLSTMHNKELPQGQHKSKVF